MSRYIVTELADNFERAHGFYLQFIEQCPDELWGKKFGAWPLWQHIVHVYGCIDHFVLQDGQQPTPYPCKAGNILAFEFDAGATMDKTAMRTYVLTMKAKAEAYINSLTDAVLGEKNAGLSARKKEGRTHALTMSMLAGHAYYHFGTLDTALREYGYKGIY
ncbi:MAG: DinB family protein [Betaproteobacteria bacterium]|nr:DinB family protein [Betaproteobacteria bacterium]